MKTVYVIRGETAMHHEGELTWLVCAYEGREAAMDRAAKAEAEAARIHRRRATQADPRDVPLMPSIEPYSAKKHGTNPFDHAMLMEDDAPTYEVIELGVVDATT